MVVLYLLCLSSFATAAPSGEESPPNIADFIRNPWNPKSSQLLRENEIDDSQTCGITPSFRQSRIAGGREAFLGEIPWVVSIQISGLHKCGGTILGKRFILSAAHCFGERYISLDDLAIVVGTKKIQGYGEETSNTGRVIGIRRIIKHQEFKMDGQYLNDVCILELSEELEWTDYTRPICLPEEDVPSGVLVTASGWGQTYGRMYIDPATIAVTESTARQGRIEHVSSVLKAVNLTIVDNVQCNAIADIWCREHGIEHTPHTMYVLDNQLCAGSLTEDSEDSLRGDSGGPLAAIVEGRWTIFGITSAARKFRSPGIYMRVTSYLQWIRQNIKD